MVLNVRNQYDQLVRETVDEGGVTGWSKGEIERAENELREAQEKELEKMRERCYMAIMEEYAES